MNLTDAVIKKERPSVEDAARLAGLGFGRDVDSDLRQNSERYSQGDFVFIATIDSKIVGWASFEEYLDGALLYLKGMMIDPDYQGGGLALRFISEARRHVNAEIFALRTQSSRMWSVGRKICDVWLPSPEGVSNGALTEAVKVLQKYGEHPVARGVYDGAAYSQIPVHADSNIQRWWGDLCSPESGDAVICVGYLSSHQIG